MPTAVAGVVTSLTLTGWLITRQPTPGPVTVTLVSREGPFAKPRLDARPYTGQVLFVSTNLNELEGEVAHSGAFDGCVYGRSSYCWPSLTPPAYSLLISVPIWPTVECPLLRPSWEAELQARKLVLTISHGPGGGCTPVGGVSQFAMFAVSLNALPKGPLSVEVQYATLHLVPKVQATTDVPWLVNLLARIHAVVGPVTADSFDGLARDTRGSLNGSNPAQRNREASPPGVT